MFLIDIYYDCKKHIHAIKVTIIYFHIEIRYPLILLYRSLLVSYVATLVYAVYNEMGGGRGSSGPSQENFEMKWYKSCKSVQSICYDIGRFWPGVQLSISLAQ